MQVHAGLRVLLHHLSTAKVKHLPWIIIRCCYSQTETVSSTEYLLVVVVWWLLFGAVLFLSIYFFFTDFDLFLLFLLFQVFEGLKPSDKFEKTLDYRLEIFTSLLRLV